MARETERRSTEAQHARGGEARTALLLRSQMVRVGSLLVRRSMAEVGVRTANLKAIAIRRVRSVDSTRAPSGDRGSQEFAARGDVGAARFCAGRHAARRARRGIGGRAHMKKIVFGATPLPQSSSALFRRPPI